MSEKHIPYQERLNRLEDFKVRYRFYSETERGRKQLPIQGIRSDFWYENDNHTIKGNFIIWPEFENVNGQIELGTISKEGIARMWIINDELRTYL